MNNRRQNRLHWLGIALLLIGIFLPTTAAAQDPTPSDDEVNRVARQLYCPVCENIPLDTCGTEACEQWRGVIRDKLQEGWSDEAIKAFFVEQYGDRVLAEPPRRGFNWLAYVVPPLAFLGGAYLLYRGFRSWQALDAERSASEDIQEVQEHSPDDKYLQRVETELRERD